MIPLYREGGLGSLYLLAVVVWFASEVTIGVRQSPRLGARRQDRYSGPALATGMVLAVYLGMAFATRFPNAGIPAGQTAIFLLGVALALGGVAIRQYAVATLGQYFTTSVMTGPGQRVVDAGLYRYVRHPSYSGLLLTLLGILLCSTNWASLACFALALPGFAYRISVEEKALTDALGEPYRDYMRRTKRLVPFVV